MLKSLPRVSSIDDFREGYFLPGRPVIVSGGARSMAASRWTVPFLAETLANQRPTIRLQSGKLATLGMRDFFRYYENASAVTSSHGPLYLTDFYVKPSFGDAERARLGREVRYPLLKDGEWDDWRTKHVGWNTLYVGTAGTSSPLHQDPHATSSWLAALTGTKIWRICAPDALPAELGPKTDPFADGPPPCEFIEAFLEQGDVMYVPPKWWHAVRNKTDAMAITGNFCTVEHGRKVHEKVKAMPESFEKGVWSKTWDAIFEEHEEPARASA